MLPNADDLPPRQFANTGYDKQHDNEGNAETDCFLFGVHTIFGAGPDEDGQIVEREYKVCVNHAISKHGGDNGRNAHGLGKGEHGRDDDAHYGDNAAKKHVNDEGDNCNERA